MSWELPGSVPGGSRAFPAPFPALSARKVSLFRECPGESLPIFTELICSLTMLSFRNPCSFFPSSFPEQRRDDLLVYWGYFHAAGGLMKAWGKPGRGDLLPSRCVDGFKLPEASDRFGMKSGTWGRNSSL